MALDRIGAAPGDMRPLIDSQVQVQRLRIDFVGLLLFVTRDEADIMGGRHESI